MPEPAPLPLRKGGNWRKRWRYVAAFDDAVMLCAAHVRIGPGGETFWAVWDRRAGRMHERTRRLAPWRRAEVSLESDLVAVSAGEVEIELRLGDAAPIEATCPNGEGAYTWTRKAAGFPVRGTVRAPGLDHEFDGRGVDDLSAGYHRRRTSWFWSAGVGEASGGRPVAWNLVTGINDPPRGSERAIWLDGGASEPGPVEFDGLEAVNFGDGSRLLFEAEGGRAHREGVPFFSSDYEAPFGTFSGSLPGVELESGLGVMERHDAVW